MSTLRFNGLLEAVIKGSLEDQGASSQDGRGDCSGTQIPSCTSKGGGVKRARASHGSKA